MADKQLAKLQGAELALGVQFSAEIAKGKSLTLTCGVPLEMEYKGINAILDKIAAALDRQELKYRRADMLDDIERYEKDLARLRLQAETYRIAAEGEWEKSGRKGPFQPRGQQSTELKNYENSERGIVEQIRILRSKVEDMSRKIAKDES